MDLVKKRSKFTQTAIHLGSGIKGLLVKKRTYGEVLTYDTGLERRGMILVVFREVL